MKLLDYDAKELSERFPEAMSYFRDAYQREEAYSLLCHKTHITPLNPWQKKRLDELLNSPACQQHAFLKLIKPLNDKIIKNVEKAILSYEVKKSLFKTPKEIEAYTREVDSLKDMLQHEITVVAINAMKYEINEHIRKHGKESNGMVPVIVKQEERIGWRFDKEGVECGHVGKFCEKEYTVLWVGNPLNCLVLKG